MGLVVSIIPALTEIHLRRGIDTTWPRSSTQRPGRCIVCFVVLIVVALGNVRVLGFEVATGPVLFHVKPPSMGARLVAEQASVTHYPRIPDGRQGAVVRERIWEPVRHFSYPIPDMGVIDDAGYDAILAVIRDELDAHRMVYVHCWGGKGRTTTVIGCLLADTGLDYDAVIARIAVLRAGTCKADSPRPETSAQRDVIRRRCDRVREQNR